LRRPLNIARFSISQSDERGVKGRAGQIILTKCAFEAALRFYNRLGKVALDPQLTMNDHRRHDLVIDPPSTRIFHKNNTVNPKERKISLLAPCERRKSSSLSHNSYLRLR